MNLIFNYLDYRKFLQDIFIEKKRLSKNFSHRAVLQRMGITSTGYIANVISGKSSLSIEGAKKLSKILKLSKAETIYFKKLVYFYKAKTIDEKNDIFKQLLFYRKRELKLLDTDQLSLFSKWSMVVIRELMHYYDFTGNFKELALMVIPSISPKEAENAVKSLQKLELIKKNDKGIFKPIDKAITTGDEVDSYHVLNFHLQMIDIAKNSLHTIKAEDRDISGLTLSVSNEKFKLIKEEIQEFRKKLLQIAVDDPEPDQVIRCNFQMFPLTKPLKKKS